MSKVATSMSVAVAATDKLIWSSFGKTPISFFFFKEILRITKTLPPAALVAMLFKTSLKFLFKQAAISFAMLLILMEIGSPLGAAQGVPNPAGFDILGMKLGMSVAEIDAAIKAYNPSLTISISDYVTSNPELGVGKPKLVHFIYAGQPGALADTIVVGFTVTQPSRAFYIGRLKQYSPEQRPLTDKTLQQLREKYGSEAGSSNSAASPTTLAGQIVGRTVFEWGGEKAGKHPFQSCVPKGRSAFWYTAQFRFGSLTTPGYYWPACGTDLPDRTSAVARSPSALGPV